MSNQCGVSAIAPQNLEVIQKRMAFSGKIVLIATVLSIIFGGIIAYCAYKIYEVVRFYIDRKQQFAEIKRKAMGTNMLFDKDNDNEIMIDSTANEDVSKIQDDYSRISSSIEKSVSSYKEYNKKLSDYYKNTFSEEAPDKIDRSILSKHDDNYK